MKKYNSTEKESCKKCGHKLIEVQYETIPFLNRREYKYSDYLLRTCSRCRYSWREYCLDYAGEIEEN